MLLANGRRGRKMSFLLQQNKPRRFDKDWNVNASFSIQRTGTISHDWYGNLNIKDKNHPRYIDRCPTDLSDYLWPAGSPKGQIQKASSYKELHEILWKFF